MLIIIIPIPFTLSSHLYCSSISQNSPKRSFSFVKICFLLIIIPYQRTVRTEKKNTPARLCQKATVRRKKQMTARLCQKATVHRKKQMPARPYQKATVCRKKQMPYKHLLFFLSYSYRLPVEPNPPLPRTVSDSSSDSTSTTGSFFSMSICATRSPAMICRYEHGRIAC